MLSVRCASHLVENLSRRLTKYLALTVQFLAGWNAGVCIKNACCEMCVTVCGRFVLNEGGAAGCVDRMRGQIYRKVERTDRRNDFEDTL